MSDWVIERIRKRHQRAPFSCGQTALDEYLRRYARQNDRADFGRTYVALPGGSRAMEVKGYYALAAGSVAAADVPADHIRGIVSAQIPIVLLARLAVDSSVQGRGLGRLLLMDAMNRARGAAESLAINALIVEAMDADARSFYLKYGFHSLLDDRRHLFISMKTIREAFSPIR